MMRFPGRFGKALCITQLVSYKPKPGPEEPRLASWLITGQDSGSGERHKQDIPLSALSPCFTERFPLDNKCPTLSASSKKNGWSRLKLRAHPSPPAPTFVFFKKKPFPKGFFLLPLQLPNFLRKSALRRAGRE